MERPSGRRVLRVIDLTALVAGYGMAALLFRAVWRTSAGVPVGLLAGAVYLWFGLAMSGPIVLLFDRRALPPPRPKPARRRVADPEALFRPAEPPSPTYTRAEQAWLLMGAYCIALTVLAIPFRLGDTPLGILAVFQILTVIGLWALGPRRQPADEAGPAWTHRVAVGVMLTWPLAWAGVILLAKS